ncbi:MAG: hypothetical protein NT016_00325 [Candidatus Aenigmarchaeota archaeon]|nr:hypothetical protein [Candidatus Aenigmarchaeota archaeon]
MHSFERYGDVEIGAFWYSERSNSALSGGWKPPQPNNYNGTHLIVIARDTATGSLNSYAVDSAKIAKTKEGKSREGMVNAILEHYAVDDNIRSALQGFIEFTKTPHA